MRARDKIKKYIISVVRDIANIEGEMSDEEILATDYLGKGLIDSFQFIEMITKLEDRFNIKFRAEDFESEEFRILLGVADIIKKRLSG